MCKYRNKQAISSTVVFYKLCSSKYGNTITTYSQLNISWYYVLAHAPSSIRLGIWVIVINSFPNSIRWNETVFCDEGGESERSESSVIVQLALMTQLSTANGSSTVSSSSAVACTVTLFFIYLQKISNEYVSAWLICNCESIVSMTLVIWSLHKLYSTVFVTVLYFSFLFALFPLFFTPALTLKAFPRTVLK